MWTYTGILIAPPRKKKEAKSSELISLHNKDEPARTSFDKSPGNYKRHLSQAAFRETEWK